MRETVKWKGREGGSGLYVAPSVSRPAAWKNEFGEGRREGGREEGLQQHPAKQTYLRLLLCLLCHLLRLDLRTLLIRMPHPILASNNIWQLI